MQSEINQYNFEYFVQFEYILSSVNSEKMTLHNYVVTYNLIHLA